MTINLYPGDFLKIIIIVVLNKTIHWIVRGHFVYYDWKFKKTRRAHIYRVPAVYNNVRSIIVLKP